MAGIPPPRMDWESTNLPDSWERFKAHVELIFKGPLKEKIEEDQIAYLLLWVGDKGREIHRTWTIPEDKLKKIDFYYNGFKNYVSPKLNPIFARYKFHNEVQGTDSFTAFLTRLRISVKDCDYDTKADEMIRDRIVFGTNSSKIRQKLINVGKDLKLDSTIQIAQEFEYSQEQMKTMSPAPAVSYVKPEHSHSHKYSGSSTSGHSAPQKSSGRSAPHNASGRSTPQRDKYKTDSCGNCGGHHQPGSCPAKGKKCNKCKKYNHFARVCRQSQRVNAHAVTSDAGCYKYDSDSSESDFFVDSVNSVCSDIGQNQAFVYARIGPSRKDVKLKVDTGSQVNILPLKHYQALNLKGPLMKAQSQLSAYSGDALKVLGTITLDCSHKDLHIKPMFYIVDTDNPPLLGLKSSIDLNVIKLVYNVQSSHTSQETSQDIMSEFKDVFTGIGLFPGECTIHLKPEAEPVVHPPRKVPVALREPLKAELKRMEDSDIVTRVTEPTDWVNSLVITEKPKTGKLRVCLDPQALNKAIRRPHYPMRTLDDILPQLADAKFFSILDARSGYWSIKLSEHSSYLTTFNTPYGRYRYLRLPFGLICSQDEFQRKSDEAFEGLEGFAAIVDDILVYGSSKEEHDINLRNVLLRARQKGVRFNADKAVICASEVPYFGHILSSKGLKADPEKISAILNMEPPRDRNELQTVLGMITYLSRFAPSLSEITTPMRSLTRENTEFVWDSAQEQAFDKVKQTITQAPVLAYYDPHKPLTLQVDASKHGLGATLLQEGKPIAFASKSLTDTEVNYAQIEKETYAILFGCKRYHQYVYGRPVKVESDHKPIESIWKKPLHTAPPRIQRMLLQLQKYDLHIEFVKGKSIPLADTLSRKYLSDTYPDLSTGLDIHVHSVVSNLPFSDAKLQELVDAGKSDQKFHNLKNVIKDGWPENRSDCSPSIIEYWNHRDELSVVNDLVFKGKKLVIPPSLRKSMLDTVHSGHMGVEKCQKRARDIMFWPKMSGEIAEYVLSCTICLERRNDNPKEPLQSYPVPERPWQVVACDLFFWNNRNYMVTVCYYSRYFEVDQLDSTTSEAVIRKLKKLFSNQGIPETLISDNGPQFSSEQFASFAKEWNFSHSTSSPLFAQSNGLAEKYVQIVKHLFDKAKADKRDPYISLLEYRNTPLECGYSPSQLLNSRRYRSVLPSTNQQLLPKAVDTSKVQAELHKRHDRQKRYFDVGSKPLKPLKEGESVRIKNNSKIWQPAIVTSKHADRSYVVQTEAGNQYRRNRRFLQKTGENHNFDAHCDFNPFDTRPSPEIKSDAPVSQNSKHILSSPNPSSQNLSSQATSDPPSPKSNLSSQPYITRSGRAVKPKVITSM